MLNLRAGALTHKLGEAAPVAMRDVALITQEAHAAAGAHDRGKFFKRFLRGWGFQMRLEDAEEFIELAAARGKAPLLRGAEFAQVQIADVVLVEPGRELPFGKSRPT